MAAAPTAVAGQSSRNSVAPELYREVLGHYPTGVVVITAMSTSGAPVGMVIGSFTSVSLEPPLVAFLPRTASVTFAELRTAGSFCVNVLAAEQNHLVGRFASRRADKFTGIEWTPSPSGAPILPGVLAWIDCSFESIAEAGDHYIVIGRVDRLEVAEATAPLVFFQSGYGRFAADIVRRTPEFIATVRASSLWRGAVRDLARRWGIECTVIARDGEEGVFVDTVTADGAEPTSRPGAWVPVRAPLQPLFVSDSGPVTPEDWVAHLGDYADARTVAFEELERVHERGWTLVLRASDDDRDLAATIQRHAAVLRTPAADRRLVAEVESLAHHRDPATLDPEAEYDVGSVSAPIRGRGDEVAAALMLTQLPAGVPGSQVLEWIDSAVRTAAVCSELLAGAAGQVTEGGQQ